MGVEWSKDNGEDDRKNWERSWWDLGAKLCVHGGSLLYGEGGELS